MIASEEKRTRHNWSSEEVMGLMMQPFNDLLFQAQQVHRTFFDPNEIQLSTLMNIKIGGCPEDCAYCPQSIHYKTEVKAERLLSVEEVLQQAKLASKKGATRFCMGAAWRQPTQKNLDQVKKMITAVKGLGMETCVTLGMLTLSQAKQLKACGLDYYNHNLDTSEEYYAEIISTREYQERLDTLECVRQIGINVCSGGIIGMGEGVADRAGLLINLANMPMHPESVPINMLVQVQGTPLHDIAPPDPIDFVRIIATTRIMMPRSYIRLSAGRNTMTAELQALCFLVGANSIFYGEKLLTTENPEINRDQKLLKKLGIKMKRH